MLYSAPMKIALKYISLSLLCLLLVACASQSKLATERYHTADIIPPQYTQTADAYLKAAADAASPEKESQLLNAAGKLLQEGEDARARQILASLSGAALPNELKARQGLLNAKLALAQGQARRSLHLLSNINSANDLHPLDQREYYDLLALAYYNLNDYLTSAEERVKLSHRLDDPTAQKQNARLIWNTLANVPLAELDSQLMENVEASELNSWFELARLAKAHRDAPAQLAAAVQQWQAAHPNHPGNTMIPDVKVANTAQDQGPLSVALLLPMQGKYGKQGKAIRDGFMAAYFQNGSKLNRKMNIKVYDTALGDDVTALYRKAVNDGNNFIIGPLQKDKVAELASVSDNQIPSVTLNYIDQGMPEQFYQYGLSPKDEAQQVAIKAIKDGRKHALIIAPEGAWGESVAQNFKQLYQALDGQVVDSLYYNRKTQFGPAIKQLLQIQNSQARKSALQAVLRDRVKFTPQRRQDFDMIFLLAQPKQARQIKPLLDYYYAGDLPVYATSQIYPGSVNSKRDRDINGIIFCDMPWVLHHNARVKQRYDLIASLWPHSSHTYPRLYALGIDAFDIATHFKNLTLFREFGLKGTTGTLLLDDSQRINRELLWLTVEKGKAQLMQQQTQVI